MKGFREPALIPNPAAQPSQVDMILRPALRLATGPIPPGFFAARFLAAVILPPLLFFAILYTSLGFGPPGRRPRTFNTPPDDSRQGEDQRGPGAE